MPIDPLTLTVLDLDAALGGNADLLIGGGFDLYLKQLHLEQSGEKTLLPRSRWPRARTTQDIDLFLRAEIIADPDQMARYRQAFDELGFVVEPDAKWLKFAREVDGRRVVIDRNISAECDRVAEEATKRRRGEGANVCAGCFAPWRSSETQFANSQQPTAIRLRCPLCTAESRAVRRLIALR